MKTPIVMLLLMTLPLAIARLRAWGDPHPFDPRGAAAIGLALLFAFTGLGHFVRTDAMAQMMPERVPQRVLLVYLTGILEFGIAAGFAFAGTRRAAGWAAAAVLVLFFPVNVHAAMQHVPMGGHEWGPVYLLIRGPLQLAILAWVYWFTIRRPTATGLMPGRIIIPGSNGKGIST